jgi:hypothetical protein
VFLLLTIGIVFILQRIHRFTREPFVLQELSYECRRATGECSEVTLSDGKKGFLCESGASKTAEDRVLDILDCDDTPEDKSNPRNVKILDGSDAVCYKKNLSGTDAFICYNRPPPLVYNSDLDRMESQMPEEDTVPQQLETILPTTCASYQGLVTYVFRYFSTLTVNKSKVDSGVARMDDAKAKVKLLYDTYCATGATLTAQQKSVCDMIGNFNTDATTATKIARLRDVQSTINESLNTIRTYYTDDIVRGYATLGCPEPNIPKPAGL